jgi:L-prolyl-PCP dehydrogenase
MIQWTDEQINLKKSIHEWADMLNEKQSGQDDREIFFKKWAYVKQTGILSLPISNEFNGLEKDILTTMYLLEEFGNICDDEGLNFIVASHIVSTSIPIQKFANQSQKEKYLPSLCTGTKIGAHAITETESGSDAFDMNTNAIKNDKGYLLNGSKTFITNGPIADVFIIYARTNETAGTLGGFSAFIVDKSTPGFSVGPPINKMGLHSSTLCDIYFDECQLSEECLLGKEGQGFTIFNYVMKWEVLCSFILNVGEMEHLLSKCIVYSKSRKQYGKSICKFQSISHKIADMKIRLETSRSMLYKAGYTFQQGKNSTVDISIAKVVTSENFVQNSLDAIQIFGGYGYMQESGIEKYLRNSVASKIYSGTSEIQRNTIASMLGL